MASLQALPNETIEHILFQLYPLEIVKCRQISKRLQRIIDVSVKLQVCIDLAIDGWLLGYYGTTPLTEVRCYQQKRREYMEEMRFSYASMRSSPMTGQFEVFDGIMAETINKIEEGIYRGVRYQENIPLELNPNRWIKEWQDLGVDIIDFSFWTHADLQILIEPFENQYRRIHFRTISENEVHPNAALPYLDLSNDDCPGWDTCNSVTYEDRIAFHFWGTRADGIPLVGSVVVSYFESKLVIPYTPVSDIAFLSRDEILLLFNGENQDNTSIGIYSIPLERVICRCRFPFAQLPIMASFLTKPESRFGDRNPFSMAKVVIPDPALAILGIKFRLREDGFKDCCMVLSVGAFQKTYPSLLDRHPSRLVFEWEEWGPTTTRWLPYHGVNPAGSRIIHGSRMLVWGRANAFAADGSGGSNLMLLDFNPRPIRKGATTRFGKKYQVLVIDQETEWQYSHAKSKITSKLPFRLSVSQEFPRHSAYRFDGSSLVGRSVRIGLMNGLPFISEFT
ncbi:hypothetical protein CPB86DRAFT_778911, partial [Serendipita vermifera]